MDEIRYRETVEASRSANALLGGAAALAFLIAVVLFAGGEVLSAVIAAVVGVAMFAAFRTFSTLVLEVDDRELRASFGSFQQSVRLQDVTAVAVERYAWLPHFGWGIRFGLDGRRAYSVPFRRTGVQVDVPKVSWYFSSAQPEALAAALQGVLDERRDAG